MCEATRGSRWAYAIDFRPRPFESGLVHPSCHRFESNLGHLSCFSSSEKSANVPFRDDEG
eukprot:scaffold112955_cov32-Tisochrysis_lutea.AAC.2